MSIVAGINVTEIPSDLSWSRAGGYVVSRAFEGTHAEIDSLIPQLVVNAGAESFSITRDSATSRLIAIFGNEGPDVLEVPVDTWEILGNDLQKEIWEHPKVLEYSASMTSVIRREAELVQSGSSTYQESIDAIETQATFEGLSAGTVTEITLLFDSLLKGLESFVTDQYVLRKSQLITSRYTAQISRTGINKIWTTAQITAVETLPAFISNELNQISTPSVPSGYAWGWLKKSPTVTQVAGNKFQLSQEWWLERWSTYVYSLHT